MGPGTNMGQRRSTSTSTSGTLLVCRHDSTERTRRPVEQLTTQFASTAKAKGQFHLSHYFYVGELMVPRLGLRYTLSMYLRQIGEWSCIGACSGLRPPHCEGCADGHAPIETI